jgi:hypothetical protein
MFLSLSNPTDNKLMCFLATLLPGDRTVYGKPSETAKPGEECWPQYAGAVPSRTDVFDWEGVESPKLSMQELCVYETHVRGLTADAVGAVQLLNPAVDP